VIVVCFACSRRGMGRRPVSAVLTSSSLTDRVGRTARGAEGRGRALLFLTAEEVGFLRYLRAAKVGPGQGFMTVSLPR
jgi:superfamily II DNA/RNA helicase